MMKLVKGTHYRRRENQPSPAPHKSKEVVDCLLCGDPGDDDGNEHVAKKRFCQLGKTFALIGPMHN